MKLWITSLFLFIISISQGQYDTTCIQKFPNHLTIKPYIDYKINQFNLDDDITGGDINYQTAQAPRIGIGADYKWMSVKTTIVPIYNINEKSKGASEQMDLQWNIYLKALSTDLRYQRYKGYYLNNSTSLAGWDMKNDGYYKREDIDAFSLGANLRYNFNYKKFSQKAAFSQTERQLTNAGTICAGIRWNMLSITADSSIIPSNITPSFLNFEIEEMKIYDQGIGLGYSYSFVHGNWFCNFTAMPYALFQIFEYKQEGNPNHKELTSFQFIFQCRGAIGYNSEKDYCGITFVSDQMRSRWKDAHDIGYNFANVKLFYARRINLKK